MQQKIPSSTYREWEKRLGASRDIPKFEAFKQFLEETFRMLEMVEPISKEGHKHKTFHLQNDSNKKKDSTEKSRGKNKIKRKCILCKGEHAVVRCQQFLNADLSKRFEIQINNNACENCLGVKLTAENCYSFKSCIFCSKGQNKNSRHHSLLHNHTQTFDANLKVNASTGSSGSNPSQSPIPVVRNYHTSNTGTNTATILATAQVRLVTDSGFVITVRALIDPCSEDNYITSNVVQLLRLPKYDSPCTVSGMGGYFDNQPSI